MDQMTFEEEEVLFDGIRSAHRCGHLISDTTWRVFLKIVGKDLYACKSVQKGWSYEVPGEANRQFKFVKVEVLSNESIKLKLGEKVKDLPILDKEADHYYGR